MVPRKPIDAFTRIPVSLSVQQIISNTLCATPFHRDCSSAWIKISNTVKQGRFECWSINIRACILTEVLKGPKSKVSVLLFLVRFQRLFKQIKSSFKSSCPSVWRFASPEIGHVSSVSTVNSTFEDELALDQQSVQPVVDTNMREHILNTKREEMGKIVGEVTCLHSRKIEKQIYYKLPPLKAHRNMKKGNRL